MKVHVLSLSGFLQFRLSRIQILVDMTGKTKGKRLKSNAILSNPSTLSSSKCERSILMQGGSVRRCEKTSISGPPSIRPSVLEYLERSKKHDHLKTTQLTPIIRFQQKTYLVSTLRHPSKSIWKKSIKHERPCLTTILNTEKRVEITTSIGVFVTNIEVFGNVLKRCLECLIYLLNRN